MNRPLYRNREAFIASPTRPEPYRYEDENLTRTVSRAVIGNCSLMVTDTHYQTSFWEGVGMRQGTIVTRCYAGLREVFTVTRTAGEPLDASRTAREAAARVPPGALTGCCPREDAFLLVLDSLRGES